MSPLLGRWFSRRRPPPDPLLPGRIPRPECFRNVAVFGQTGSGKTSYLKKLVRLLLRNRDSLLIVGAKPGDAPMYAAMAAEEGRGDDVRLFDHRAAGGINVSDAVRNRHADPQSQSIQLAEAFRQSIDAMMAGRGEPRSGERFFELNADDLTRRGFLAQLLAGLPPSVPLLRRMLETLTVADGELAWVLHEAAKRTKGTGHETLFRKEVDRFFTTVFPKLADKTRDGIVATVLGPAGVYTGVVELVLYAERPLDLGREIEQGAVFITDFPFARDGAVSSILNGALKYALQRTVLRREVTERTRPFLAILDEYGSYVSSSDAEFFSTCRSARAGNVIALQGRESLIRALSGKSAEHECDVILGNCSVHIHMKPTEATGSHLCESLGQVKRMLMGGGVQHSPNEYRTPLDLVRAAQTSTSASFSEQYVSLLQPSSFARMRTGGPRNNGRVDMLRVPGSDGQPFEKLTLTQEGFA